MKRAYEKIAEGLREAIGWRRLEGEEALHVRDAIRRAKTKLRERTREG